MDAAVAQVDAVGDGDLGVEEDFEQTVAQILHVVLDVVRGGAQRHVQRPAARLRRVHCTQSEIRKPNETETKGGGVNHR